MGCDGGTIPRRDELVRTKKKKEAKDKNADKIAKWKYCAISSKELIAPIVSCELGRLYNKDVVIEYLLNKETPNSSLLTHVRSLKDVVTLNLTLKKDQSDSSQQSTSVQYCKYVCPIIGLEMNGNYKFCYIRSCGCVISERALKKVSSEVCLVCNKPYVKDDLIVINGDKDELELLQNKMIDRRRKIKENKKRKKANDQATKDEDVKKIKAESSVSKISTFQTVKTSSLMTLSEKASKDYSVSKDPNASEVYKSLFTSHESAKNRPKAHWVTFNPCYN